jgi:bifunctional DNA-binding transcriptional regulator/antitoxin component of YhaV-PrlF toxin-antitoxin module
MGRRKITEENIRVIQKIKRSYYLTIPIEIVRAFKWQVGREVVVEKRGKEIVIKEWK